MSDDQKFYSRDIEAEHVVGIQELKHGLGSHARKNSRVIHRSKAASLPKRKVLIGGACDESEQIPPTIILQKKGEKIQKISVKCPCGRHAELTCEYETEGS